MLLQPTTSTMDLTVVREGRRAVAQLKNRTRYNTLTPGDRDRLIERIAAAFEEFSPIIDESPDPVRATFQLVQGGR